MRLTSSTTHATVEPVLDLSRIAAIAIGRNEGARLEACLASLQGRAGRVIYVDSGSSDGSIAAAEALGAEVAALDMTQPFTAARARNAGRNALGTAPAYLHFVDGDCVIREDWIETAAAFLDAHPKAAVACGRRRERFPETSVYNHLTDMEWDTPVGQAKACGGDALMRAEAFDAVGGFREDLIAGEEPELCVRLRQAGWEIWRLDAEMTWHDADMHRFSQWWQRSRRAGHAFAEGASLHGAPPERHWVRETLRSLVWGAALPAVVLLGALIWPPALLGLLAYPLQVLRLSQKIGWTQAIFSIVGKFAEAQGALGFLVGWFLGRRRRLIEYK